MSFENCTLVDDENDLNNQVNDWAVMFEDISKNYINAGTIQIEEQQKRRLNDMMNCIDMALSQSKSSIKYYNERINKEDKDLNETNDYEKEIKNINNKIKINQSSGERKDDKYNIKEDMLVDMGFYILGVGVLSYFLFKQLKQLKNISSN
tara:strand:- start:3782 stop:4231 length:450 start_codon:yes stop_codon:yes gene_type:complete